MYGLQVALKCADIGHLAATPEVHKRWALLLEEEFFLQVLPLLLSASLVSSCSSTVCSSACTSSRVKHTVC